MVMNRLTLNLLKIGFTLCLLFSVVQGYAQSENLLSGKVVGSDDEPLPFAYVALTSKEGKVASYTRCTDSGTFTLRDIASGQYKIVISYVGYKDGIFSVTITSPNQKLGQFKMIESEVLDASVVQAAASPIKAKSDRLIYDISKDPSAKKSSVLTVLDKIPFVEIDKTTDQIKVMGSDSGFSIVINGKESLLLSEANQYVAKVLEASQLKQIELITTPDGKYAGQNAVINIVTESSLPDGFAATISANAGIDNNYRASAALTSKINKFIYNLKYAYSFYDDPLGEKSHRKMTNYSDETNHFLESYSESRTRRDGHSMGIKASYTITDNNLISASFSANPQKSANTINYNDEYRNIANEVVTKTNSMTSNSSDNLTMNGELSYQHSFASRPGRLFTATYKYDYSGMKKLYDYTEHNLINGQSTFSDTQNNLKNRENVAALDYYTPLSKGQSCFLTAKYVNRYYESVLNDVSALNYYEDIVSFTGNYTLIKNKISLSAQVSIENISDDIHFADSPLKKNYWAFLPRIFFTYRPAPKSNIMLTLTNRVFRPDISYLNPYEEELSPNYIKVGNPNLTNTTMYFSSLKYTYYFGSKFDMTLDVGYSFFDKLVQRIGNVRDDGVYVSTYQNIGKRERLMGIMRMNYMPTRSSSFSLSCMMSRNIYYYDNQVNAYWSPRAVLSVNAGLWKGAYLSGILQYTTPFMDNDEAQTKSVHNAVTTFLFLTQSLGKNWKISLNAITPWKKTEVFTYEKQTEDFYDYTETEHRGRVLSLSVTYTFGRFKESVKNSRRKVMDDDRTL